jgi:type IV secretion system protein VirB5
MGARWRCLFWACLLIAPAARAQYPVIDIAAISKLVAEIQTLERQLAQAQAEYAAITGGRGMERLLSGQPRNYLPSSWPELQTAMQSGGGALGAGIAASVAANSVIPPQTLALLPPDVRKQIDTARRLTALQQNLTRQALLTTSNRFTSLQQLIEAIGGAADQKAALDLQARVNSENSMLQNETSKLLTLYQLVQSEEHANREWMRERAVLAHGQFDTRFQPVP